MSQAGDVAQFTTLALLVFHPTGSGLGVSGAAAAETAPVLLFAPWPVRLSTGYRALRS